MSEDKLNPSPRPAHDPYPEYQIEKPLKMPLLFMLPPLATRIWHPQLSVKKTCPVHLLQTLSLTLKLCDQEMIFSPGKMVLTVYPSLINKMTAIDTF